MWNDLTLPKPLLPKPFTRVWVQTDTGRQVAAYLNDAGEWVILCPRVAETHPRIVKWSYGYE
ncbi:hypothetical protein ACSV3Y_002458 [Escherichia coli]